MLQLRLPSSWIPAVAGLTGVFATLALQPAPTVYVAAVAPNSTVPAIKKTYLDFINPMHMMLSAELSHWVTVELTTAAGTVLMPEKVRTLASNLGTQLANRASEWKWNATELDWTVLGSDRAARMSPRANDSLARALGKDGSPLEQHVYSDIETRLKRDLTAALLPYVNLTIGAATIQAAASAVEESIPRSATQWICIYHRETGMFQWYNPQTQVWGGPSKR